ncbi:MAG: Crp/Fnr family transcriptional regulator [Leptolyngbyaceae cyanobacterium CRU_2_3]|nr:Crp/Fnr family transcriptional regulator [Leptolyngbyaceae cyanobacterium CRU_2_3]
MNSLRPEQFPADLQALIEYRELANGQTLFYKGDLTQAAFWLETGQLRLLHYTPDGQAVNHYRIRAGESFAEVALFINVYDCTAIAEAPSRVALLPKQFILEALGQSPDLAEMMMKQLAWRLHQAKILLELRSIRSARDRVLHYLKLSAEQLSDQLSDQLFVHLDQPMKRLAEDLALTPEALSRALTQLETEQIISRQKRMVQFL